MSMDVRTTSKEATRALIARLGGPSAVGRLFRPAISSQAVSQWARVPARRCVALEQASGGRVTRHELRPDVFGPGRPRQA